MTMIINETTIIIQDERLVRGWGYVLKGNCACIRKYEA